MKDLISIIVPIYKVEKHLKKCIKSIVGQSYTNLEIILVDDGSPDNCGKICDEYAKKDCRIKVIHKKNGGLSDARNCGIDKSSGKYLMFVDSDDYVDKNICEKLINASKEYDCDIVMCNIYRVVNNKICIEKEISALSKNEVLDGITVMKEFFKNFSIDLYVSWNKLYKRELFFGNKKIRFPFGELFEDMFIDYKLYNLSKRILILSDRLYYYVIRENSITNINYTDKHLLSRLNYLKNIRLFSQKVDEDIKKCIQKSIIRYCYEITRYCILNKNLDKSFMKEAKYILLDERFLLKNDYISIKDIIKYFFVKYDKSHIIIKLLYKYLKR